MTEIVYPLCKHIVSENVFTTDTVFTGVDFRTRNERLLEESIRKLDLLG